MGDEVSATQPSAQAAPAVANPATAAVDARAAALAILNKASAPSQAAAPAAQAPDPKASAPSASANGGSEAGKAESAPGTAAPAAAEPALPPELAQQRQQLSRGFAKLATEKAALLQKEQSLKGLERFVGFDEKVKADPAVLLDLYGADLLERLAVRHLERSGAPVEITVEDRVAALEAEKKALADAKAKEESDRAARAPQEAREQGVKMVADHLATMADQFPVTVSRGEAHHVFDAVARFALKHNLPFEQVTMDTVTVVAKAYEEARQAQVDEEFSALAPKVPKLAARLAPPKPETPAQAPSGDQVRGAQAGSVTLAGRAANEAPPPQPARVQSKEELRELALQHFKKPAA